VRMKKSVAKEADLLEFAEEHVRYAGVALRNEADYEEWIKKHAKEPRLVLMTNKQRVPLLYKVLSVAFGQIRFAAMRHTQDTDFLYRRHDLKGVPALMWFGPAQTTPEHYHSEFTRRSIADFLTNAIPFHGRFVHDRDSLNRFLITNAGRAKVLLVTARSSVPVGFKLLTMELKHRADFAIAQEGDSGGHFVTWWYRSTGVATPGALFFRDGDTKPLVAPPSALTRTALRNFILQQLQGEGARQEGDGMQEGQIRRDAFEVSGSVQQLTAGTLPRLCPRSVSCVGNRCQEAICAVLATVPTFIDMRAGAVRELFDEAIRLLATKEVMAPVQASWIDGVQNTGFLQAIGAELAHLPKLVVIRPRSGRVASLSLDEKTPGLLAHWLVEASAGRVEWGELSSNLVDVIL